MAGEDESLLHSRASGDGADAARTSGGSSSKKQGGNGNAMMASLMAAIIVVLPLSGCVPWGDIFFAIFSSLYIYAMSKTVFPPVTSIAPPGFYPGRLFRFYITSAGIIGLLVPLVFIILSTIVHEDEAVGRVAPHLFLLSVQVLSEIVSSMSKSPPTSLPIKALVPILHNSWRLLTLWTWAGAVFGADLKDPALISRMWLLFERLLAVSNVILWNYNLWVFLLPNYLPRVLRDHFGRVRE